MKEIRDTLNPSILLPGRRTGNTLRQVDYAIQLLYLGYKIQVKDNWCEGANQDANKLLFRLIMKRLTSEHSPKASFMFDVHKLTIEATDANHPFNVIQYEHHGVMVSVVADLKGQHREHCLCFKGCKYFKPNTPDNCRFAQELYEFVASTA